MPIPGPYPWPTKVTEVIGGPAATTAAELTGSAEEAPAVTRPASTPT
ncbi:MAG TPA: hypothetical protein VKR27_05440 [Acidimicrobiales bacterium]|nr:hypothetical protein [Acidimicrobiales bacterium]